MKKGTAPRQCLSLTVFLAAGIVVACSVNAPPWRKSAQDIITPAAAAQVVKSYWAVNEKAAQSNDSELFAQIQSGLLLEADRGIAQAYRALGSPHLASPRPLRKVTTFVTHQHIYPAEFLALIETVGADQGGRLTSQPLSFLDHFVRPSSADPWKADFYVVVDLARGIHLALDSDGYAAAVALSSTKYAVRPEQLAPTLVTYWESGTKTGSPSGPYAPGSLTTGSVESLRNYASNMSQVGYKTDFGFVPGTLVRAYRMSNGQAMVLFAFTVTEIVTPASADGCILQPKNKLESWGGLVPAGSWSSLATDLLVEAAAIDPIAAPNAQVDVVFSAADVVAARTGPPVPGCQAEAGGH